MALRTPTGLLADRPPAWSILDIARPMTDIGGIDSEADWARGGINLWWRSGQVHRLPMTRAHTTPFADPDGADLIADPAVWPAAVEIDAGVTFSAPSGIKADRAENQYHGFRPFWIQAPIGWWDTTQDPAGTVGDEVAAEFEAHKAWAVAAELTDSLYSKNPGLQLLAVDQSAATPVHPVVAIATLYEAFANDPAEPSPNGSGDAMLTVPYHAVPFLLHYNLAGWVDGRLLDCYGNPVNATPGVIPQSPVSDPTDLETTTAPTAGNGWFYISPRPYAVIGSFVQAVQGDERAARGPAPSGLHVGSNQVVDMKEAPAIVAIRPTRVYAVETSLNASIA